MMTTQMEKEALAAPQVLAKQFSENQSVLKALCARLQSKPPRLAMTIARGSSDHAATFAKYLLETQLGLVTASAAPSAVTLYGAALQLQDSLVIGLSQSGQSPDLAEMMAAARRAGAVTVAFVNKVDSPLAHAAEFVVPLCADDELAVAATKSYIATLGALIQFVACWKQDALLVEALERLPTALHAAAEMDWSAMLPVYQQQANTLVVGRGYGFPIAQEAALKFKETAVIHAEAFSGAELLHGPFALVQEGFPLLMFAQHDAALPGILALATRVKEMGAQVMLAAPAYPDSMKQIAAAASVALPLPAALHPICDPLMVIQAFYVTMSRLAVARGFNPDKPTNLLKVTKTW